MVALRKESVDRNLAVIVGQHQAHAVALRKESVDRNVPAYVAMVPAEQSLSARRAWIEMQIKQTCRVKLVSLSARRAWIEIFRLR